MKKYVLTYNLFFIFSFTKHYISNTTKKSKTEKNLSMKKAVLAGVVGVFALGMLSCGGGHGGCDAYRKSDYTKYKEQKTQKIELISFDKIQVKKKK